MTRTETQEAGLDSRKKSFAKWFRKNGDLNNNKNKNDKWRKKKNQRALILAAKRTITIYACSDLERQICYFAEKRYNNSKWPKITQEEAWQLWRLTNPIMSDRLRMLKDSAEDYYKQRNDFQKELKLLRELRVKYGSYAHNKAKKKPTIQYKRKAS